MNASEFSQPSLKGSRVPAGHVLVNSKFQGGQIIKLIQEACIKPVIQEGMGMVDFYPTNKFAIIWIPEDTLIMQEVSVEKKLIKFDKALCTGIVCVHVTETSRQYYKKLQTFALKNVCNATIVPVKSLHEMIKFITHLVYNDCNSTQTFKSVNGADIDEDVIGTLKAMPSVGEKKAKELLKLFPSIAEISHASFKDMEIIVGKSVAQNIDKLMDGKK